MDDLEDLRSRLAVLEAESEIRKTLNRYGHTIGMGDEEGWLDCFTADAVFIVRRREMASLDGAPRSHAAHPHPAMRGGGDVSITFAGREELRKFISSHPHPPTRFHKHIIIDPVIEVTGRQANSNGFFVRLDAGPDGVPHLTSFGWYRDKLAECDDRRWRIVERRAEVDARGPDPFEASCRVG